MNHRSPTEMRFVLDNMFVKFLPEGEHGGPVQVSLVPAQLNNIDSPVGDVFLKSCHPCSIRLEMKTRHFSG